MAAPSTFRLPAGVHFEITDAGLVVSHDGNVVLEQTMGHRLVAVTAGGNLTLQLEEASGDLHSDGKLTIESKRVQAGTIHGREVHLGNQSIKARAISATHRIVIGAAQLAVDIIIAPEIRIDGRARGRVTVIESHNDRDPTRIKGGFSLSEYDELFGDSGRFLAQRGVERLSEPTHPAALPMAPGSADDEDELIEVDFDAEDEAPDPSPIPVKRREKPVRVAHTAQPVTRAVDDRAPVHDDDDLHPKLLEASRKIAACYEGKEVPPAVSQLQSLIDQRDYSGLRRNITEVWNTLLTFHQRKGIRPHHQVTHAFKVIHSLVQG